MSSTERSDKAKKVLWVIGAFIGILLVLVGKANLNKEQKECVWFGVIIYLFAVVGYIDYTVVMAGPYWPNGLMPYWMSLATLYIALTFLVSWHSYMYTDSVKNAFKHGFVTISFLIGALADWFFFLWGGYVDNLNMQWTWMWQHMVFGWWTGWAQIAFSLCTVLAIVLIWIKIRD